MHDAFQSKPDFTPYDVRPHRVPLTENIKVPPACGLDTPANAAATPPVSATAVSSTVAWQTWASKQRLSGRGARADFANPELMNRFTWYDAHHYDLAYPGDPKVYVPEEVPGAALSGSDTD